MKIVALCLAVLLLVSNAFWIFFAVDTAITRSYHEASMETVERSLRSLLQITDPLLRGKTVAEVRALAKGKVEDADVFEKANGGDQGEDLLVVGGVVISLDTQGRVAQVSVE